MIHKYFDTPQNKLPKEGIRVRRRDELELWSVDDYLDHVDEQSYLIDGLLLSGTHTLLYAPTGHLKSFTAIDLACHIATGKPYHGRSVDQGEVIYVAAEGQQEIANRIQAWESWHKTRTNILFMPRAIQLSDDVAMDRLSRRIEDRNGAVKLVVFDTVSRGAYGVDENAPTDVNRYVNAAVERLIAETGVTVMLVHHQGTNSRGPRGCTAWSDPCDTIIRVGSTFEVADRREGPITVTVSIEKQRSGEPTALAFRPNKCQGTLVLSPITDEEAAALAKPRKARTEKPKAEPKLAAKDKIVSALTNGGSMRLSALVREAGASEKTVKNNLTALKNEGVIEGVDGWYSIKAT